MKKSQSILDGERYLVFCFLFLLFLSTVFAQEVSATKKVQLLSGVVLSEQKEKPLTLHFRLTNDTETPIQITSLGVNQNKIIIIKPDGTKVEHVAWKDGIKPDLLQPGETKEWKLEIGKVFALYGLKAEGIYKIHWEVNGIQANELFLQKEK